MTVGVCAARSQNNCQQMPGTVQIKRHRSRARRKIKAAKLGIKKFKVGVNERSGAYVSLASSR